VVKQWSARAAVVVAVAAAAAFLWQTMQEEALPPTIAGSNGRIEAVEINIAAKTAGRVVEVLVDEGDMVSAGDVLGRMDTAVLDAELHEAKARCRRATIAIDIAERRVTQRSAELAAARALVRQRRAELDAADKRLARTAELVPKGTATGQDLDDDRAALAGAVAAVSAAEAQVAAAEAARGLAESEVIAAQAEGEAVAARIERIEAEIDDSVLRAPRDGRVQYRVAQPGEVLAAGGTVLNLVDLTDVYMTFFLPTRAAGRVALGSEVRLVLDAAPQYVIPARVSFVAAVAQFTPKTVQTADERQKLMFRIKARIDRELLRRHLQQVKAGLPGMAYLRLDPQTPWPPSLALRLPQ
jgi:HlyD family secretion protein